MKNRKITYLLLTGFILAQINTTGLSFFNLKCLGKTVKSKQPFLLKKMFSKKATLLSITTIASTLFAYKTCGFLRKVYYGVKLRKAKDKSDYEVIKEINSKFNPKEMKYIKWLAKRKTAFSWFFPDWFPFV